MRSLLVMIDMVNGFANYGNLSSSNVAELILPMKQFVKTFLLKKIRTIHYTDFHRENAKEFLSYPKHCVIGSGEEKVVEELDLAGIEVIQKNSTNGFLKYNPSLNNSYDYVFIIGCVSDICIYEYAITYQKFLEEHDLETKLIVVDDLVATFDAPNHDAKLVHRQSMDKLAQNGITILSSREVLQMIDI